MEDQKDFLLQKLRQVEEDIAEQEKRLPPHSVKPEQIQELERLEEARDEIQKQLRQMETGDDQQS
ncbi:MAG: hypothetical protein ACLFS7_01610 [Desulfosudaceae bacterium]